MLLGAVIIYSLILKILIPVYYYYVPLQLEDEFKVGLINVDESVILASERYDLSIILELPESEANFKLGHFIVEVKLNKDEMVRKLCIVKYRSPLIRAIRSFLLLIPIFTGIWEESQTVQIELNTQFQIEKDMAIVEVKVYPRDIQVYNIFIRLEVKETGWRSIIQGYYYISWIISVLVILYIEHMVIRFLLILGKK
jgi:hypothetical protein